MSTPFLQPVNPDAAPDPVTPADSPGDAAGWAEVTPPGAGTAPYDISGPQDIAGITAAFDTANALSASGVLYPEGPRQHETQAFLDSPQGVGAMSITAGFPDYENTDPSPGPDMENPIQGHTDEYPGTTQDGVPQFMAGLGGDTPGSLPGVAPEGGSMDTPGGNYPGTSQGGLTTYGTS